MPAPTPAGDVFSFGSSAALRWLWLLLVGLMVVPALAILAFGVAVAFRAPATGAALVAFALVLLGAYAVPVGQTAFFFTGGRWQGAVAFTDDGVVVHSPALLAGDWRIARAEVASVRWTSPSGALWTVRLRPVEEVAPRRKTSEFGWRSVSPTGLTGGPPLYLEFARPLLPPARWRRIAAVSFRGFQPMAVRRGEPVSTLVLPLHSRPPEVRAALERWGVAFPATLASAGGRPDPAA